jgi:hypothetical protein
MTEAGPIPERQVLEEQRNRAEITQKNCRLDGIPLLIGPQGALGAVPLIPRLADQNLWAQLRSPKVIMRQG